MQVDTNWYWNKHPQNHVITVTTRTILHPRLEFNVVTYFHTTPKRVCTRRQAKQSTPRQPIRLTDSDYDYTLEELFRRYKIYFERDVDVYSNDKEN